MSQQPILTIRRFAQIRDVHLRFGDLTVLVGAQGTGKSLALQWLKTAVDGRQIANALQDAGMNAANPDVIIDLIFGVGMRTAWKQDTRVTFDKRSITPKNIGRIGDGTERVFYIPAHRSMLVSDGWAAPFQRLSPDTPVVARLFSQNLFSLFSGKSRDTLFPIDRILQSQFRDLIDKAVYHGGTVGLEDDQMHAKRLSLAHGDTRLPFMSWTAGQREFTPLLLGLYHLLPHVKMTKQPKIDWVIIEEPEMGLHPQAITVFLLLVLDLLQRGYRVVLSTHSPHLLTGVWMLQRLQNIGASWKHVCTAFQVEGKGRIRTIADDALRKSYVVHFFEYADDGRVMSSDISSLDPDSDNLGESDWGGLTGYSSRFGDAVRKAVNEMQHA